MKKVTQGYVILNKKGKVQPNTFREYKNTCIKSFEGSQPLYLWDELKSWGWKCVKSTQTIEIKE